MWILLLSLALTTTLPVHGQQPPSRCVSIFDQGFRKCFRDMGGFELDIVFSLVTNETSGRLPPNLAPQKPKLVQTICGNRQGISNCITPLVTSADPTCQQSDIGMMDGTVNSMVSGLGNLCGAPSQGSACMKNFDTGFRQCLTSIQINPDHFFMLLADQPLPTGVSKDQLKSNACSDKTRNSLMQCATGIIGKIQADCKPQETIMVGTTLQNMMGAYEGVCTNKSINPGQCMAAFEDGMNTCAQRTLNMDMKLILMVLNGQTLPAGQDAAALKKSVCGKWKPLEICGKDVVLAAGCARSQLLGVEATFANMMITVATFCGDTSIPGACLLTLQKQFGECFGKVGLAPEIYLSNATDHKGALIGANTEEAKVYCSKKHDLFTCMQGVIHQCPGAEQTLSLTGFDLHGMERAVGLLCHDIPDYLAGLECFENPTDNAKQCMEDMTMAITDMSTKQITQKLDMDGFFQDFCTARVKHVACDSKSWPSCDKAAVDLKNQFECQLIPSRCYNSHKDNIDVICPNTEVYIPDGDTEMHVHQQPPCAQNIHQSMNKCFQKYNMEPDMFLVNITHDRRNFMGDADRAKSLCMSKDGVFRCMRSVLESCPAAKKVLAFWGHQQASLENAVNLICRELPLYSKSIRCFANGNSQVQQCISNTESKMMNLADKQVTKNLSPDSYFRDFCSIRVEHLRCDLNGWSQTCDEDVVGLKTEFECKLIQEHCKNLQVGNFKNICNEGTYKTSTRGSGGSGNNGGNTGSQSGNGDNGCSSTSGSLFALLSSVIATAFFIML
ncbi:uncharacterized protein LOC132735862 isoform X2 [Ruditapes philippinarum]|uniref:uncharacterized protein LOC132735862 isoform X2 n=1 Tax=Ruditapes philippinarum TaxID=129788 RepID=UPI00295AC0F6|nr:uncharacterized protein LOC132735862 isoform X2 [Ruditapes philippinarum]